MSGRTPSTSGIGSRLPTYSTRRPRRSPAITTDNYLDDKEADTPGDILAAGTYRRAVESTNAYLTALAEYNAALEAVEDAGARDRMEQTAAAPPTPESVATPTPDTRNKLIQRFGCQWIMDNYRTMSAAGRDTAILHVSNVMNLQDSSSYVSAGDAAAAIQDCEGAGYR